MRYFKKLIPGILAMLIVLCISSCKKEITQAKNVDPTGGVVSLIKSEGEIRPGKYVLLRFDQAPDNIDTATSFSISLFAKFTNDDNSATLNAGKILLNGSLAVNSAGDNTYEYRFAQAELPMGKASMGNFINIGIEGNSSVDSLSRKIYIPRPIFITNLYKPISTISNNKSYNLSWNADPQNMFAKVWLQVSYYSGLSTSNNPGNPVSVDKLSYIVNDNGNFVIPSADLKRFPVSSYISISISRATDNIWPTNKSHIEYIAVANASTSPILVQN